MGKRRHHPLPLPPWLRACQTATNITHYVTLYFCMKDFLLNSTVFTAAQIEERFPLNMEIVKCKSNQI